MYNCDDGKKLNNKVNGAFKERKVDDVLISLKLKREAGENPVRSRHCHWEPSVDTTVQSMGRFRLR